MLFTFSEAAKLLNIPKEILYNFVVDNKLCYYRNYSDEPISYAKYAGKDSLFVIRKNEKGRKKSLLTEFGLKYFAKQDYNI